MEIFAFVKDNVFVFSFVVGVLQFIFTIAITVVLHNFSKRQHKLEVLRSVDAQWQELNKMRISDPSIQEAIMDPHAEEGSPHHTIRKNVVYYLLNTFQQVVRARNDHFISKTESDALIESHVGFFKEFPKEIDSILAKGDGFSPDMLKELRIRWHQ